jgi:hypothetical protein
MEGQGKRRKDKENTNKLKGNARTIHERQGTDKDMIGKGTQCNTKQIKEKRERT